MSKDLEVDVVVLADGTVKFLYYDELKPLLTIGNVDVSRASHVDPERLENGDLKWFADLSPVNGPKLGPFETRTEAIGAEVVWLTENYLSKQDVDLPKIKIPKESQQAITEAYEDAIKARNEKLK